jgi:hypothetical protein
VSLLEKAGSTVVENSKWDLPKVFSQGIAELLKYADNRRFSSEPDVVKSKDIKPLQDLVLSATP